MDKETKKMVRNNTIKFVIGTFLLVICYLYIQKHPAEKISVISGFEVMYQRAQVLFYNVIGKDSDLLERKYNLEKYFTELIRMAEDKKCMDVVLIKDLHEKYNSLKQEDITSLKKSIPDYIRFVHNFDAQVKEGCK